MASDALPPRSSRAIFSRVGGGGRGVVGGGIRRDGGDADVEREAPGTKGHGRTGRWAHAWAGGVGWVLPIAVIVAELVATLAVWDALRRSEARAVRAASSAASDHVIGQLQTELRSHLRAMGRMARRADDDPERSRAAWEADGREHLRDFPSMRALGVMSDGAWRALVSRSRSDSLAALAVATRVREATDGTDAPVVLGIPLPDGVRGLVLAVPGPSVAGERHHVVAVLHAPSFVASSLANTASDFAVAVHDGDVPVFRRLDAGTNGMRWEKRATLPSGAVAWTIRVWPGDSLVTEATSQLPGAVLLFGIVLAVPAGLVTRLTQVANERERRYRALFEHAPDAIVVFDVDSGRFVEANANAERLFDLPRERLLELGPAELSPPTQPDGRPSDAAARAWIDQAVAGGAPRFEWLHRDTKGEEIPCEVRLVRFPAHRRVLVRGSISDARDRVALERQLRQAQKMEAVGQLAGGIAHDFNNILAAVMGLADLLVTDLPAGSTSREDALEIRDSARRAAGLTRQLLAFSRKQTLSPRPLDLNAVITDLERMLRRTLGDDVILETQLAADVGVVRADPSAIEQVLVNLAINARDAMPDGGTIAISTRRRVVTRPGEFEDAVPGEYVELEVRDDGVGMPPDVSARVFEPFFTTKPAGKGTGLGLAMVYGIVRQTGGHIAVTSTLGAGTAFTIVLPRTSDAPPSPES